MDQLIDIEYSDGISIFLNDFPIKDPWIDVQTTKTDQKENNTVSLDANNCNICFKNGSFYILFQNEHNHLKQRIYFCKKHKPKNAISKNFHQMCINCNKQGSFFIQDKSYKRIYYCFQHKPSNAVHKNKNM